MEAKIRRQQLVQSTRQGVVLEAARAVIDRVGVDKASMREIAGKAGYTPGALYAFFPSKQALLTALLEGLLLELGTSVGQIRAGKASSDQGLLPRAEAWLSHFVRRPRDWELLVHFLHAPGQRKLPPEVASRVHALLRQSLEPVARSLRDLGLDTARLELEMEALLAFAIGLLLAQDTTRLQPAEQSPQALLLGHLQKLLASVQPVDATAAPVPGSGPEASQAGLFG